MATKGAIDTPDDFLKSLEFDIPTRLRIEAYKDIRMGKWPAIKDDKGEKPLPSNWEFVGFDVVYPSTEIRSQMARKATKASMEKIEGAKGKTIREHVDVGGLIHWVVNHVITGMYHTEKPELKIEYNGKRRDRLEIDMLACNWLWVKFSQAYAEFQQAIDDEEEEEQGNSSASSPNTSENISQTNQ